MTEFLSLNDDCVRHVFRFLDIKALCATSETCKQLKEIAEEFYKKHTSYECCITHAGNVKEVTKIIQKIIQQHLTKLDLTLEQVFSEFYEESGIGCQFLLQLNCLLGENFRELTLYGQIWSISLLRLASTLFKLEKLSICCEYDETQDGVMFMDFPQLCPNLRTLRIEGCALIFAPNSIKTFKKLEALSFMSYGPYYPMDSFISLIKAKKQLKKFDIDILDEVGNAYVDLTIVAKNLEHSEDLRIRTVLFGNLVVGIRDLKQLHQLTTLVVSEYWDDLEELSAVLDIVKTMKQLKKMRIGNCMCGTPSQQSVVNISKHLQILVTFESNIECDANTVTEFVQFGRNLKRFSVQASRREMVTLAFIENLAKVREYAAQARPPLSLYIYRAELSSDVKKVKQKYTYKRCVRRCSNAFS